MAKALGLYQDCDPDLGVTDEMFMEEIYECVRREHYDEERDDIAEEWDRPLYEQVVKIYEELEVGKQK